jgi:hypothetical protein
MSLAWAEGDLAVVEQELTHRMELMNDEHLLRFTYRNIVNGVWRRGRDSNPRYGCPYAAFRVRCIQPLCHLSIQLKSIINSIANQQSSCPGAKLLRASSI